jgi:hypothetical protein
VNKKAGKNGKGTRRGRQASFHREIARARRSELRAAIPRVVVADFPDLPAPLGENLSRFELHELCALPVKRIEGTLGLFPPASRCFVVRHVHGLGFG